MRSYSYLLLSAKKSLLGQGFACPSCGARDAKVVDRKWLVTSLRRCGSCRLLYRTPTTSEEENERIYQTTYREGFTTDLPSDAELKQLIETEFAASEKNYRPYIDVLEALGAASGSRLFDFGCSWGYGSWQLARHGYQTAAYEISKPRAQFAARKGSAWRCEIRKPSRRAAMMSSSPPM